MTIKKYIVNFSLGNNNGKVQKQDPKKEPDFNDYFEGPADFETAVTATSFGKYNLFLILIGIPCGLASIFETTTMSYVFPAAQCDLNLSLDDKGLLNAVTYLGMISSAMIWGFLYDTLGRKKLLMVGFFLDGIFVIISSLSQTKILLMVMKFLGGFIINGPFAAFTSYLSEFHAAKYRARMQLAMGAVFNFGSIILPLMAWIIMPQDLFFSVLSLEFHSWNVYLLICALPSSVSALVFIFMPESPKFLMTSGRNDKALEVFRRVYSINTGKPPESYPIRVLVDETATKEQLEEKSDTVQTKKTKIEALRQGWQQMKPLFLPPYLKFLVLTCSLQLFFTMGLNTLRLWFPQIFQAMNDYEFFHPDEVSDPNRFCDTLEMLQQSKIVVNTTFEADCIVNLNNSGVYINSIIVAATSTVANFSAGYLINIVGKKRLLYGLSIFAGLCSISIYFSINSAFTIAFSALFISSASVGTNVIITVIIDLFPTTLRTMTVSLAMMLARGGAMAGNLLFPFLLRTGCAAPFVSVASVIFSCTFLTLLLPNTDMKALQ